MSLLDSGRDSGVEDVKTNTGTLAMVKSTIRITKNVTCGAVKSGFDVVSNNMKMGEYNLLIKKGLVSGGSDALADLLAINLAKKILPDKIFDLEEQVVRPILSAAIYTGADMYYFNYDNNTLMIKFLSQLGSSMVAAYGEQSIEEILGL